jgi:hypothetical protein
MTPQLPTTAVAINQQAARLQNWVQALRPLPQGPPLCWLLHTVTPGVDLRPWVAACETALAELGWETPAQMAARVLSESSSQQPSAAKAFVACTEGATLQPARLAGTSAIIFVLDTTPPSLIKTYHQIKQLVGQRRDLTGHLGLLFTPPVGAGRQRLLEACRQFLDFTPIDLGTIPRFSNHCPSVEPHITTADLSGHSMNVWRQVVRRGLCGL